MRLVQFTRPGGQPDIWVNPEWVSTVEHSGRPADDRYETAIRMGASDDAHIIVDGICVHVAAKLMAEAGGR